MSMKRPVDWAAAACDSLMSRFPDPLDLPPRHKWHYHQGVFLCGMLQLWRLSGEDRYLHYVKKYADGLIDPLGNLYFARDELDAIQAGLILFVLDEQFDDPRYLIAAKKLRSLFDTLNRTSEGGFWHKDKYPYQMWLDGLYMGGVFALEFGKRCGEQALTEMVVRQERLMRSHMKDESTGLLYHAWDERKAQPWADPATGRSPEFWGRSLGWYGLALVEFIDLVDSPHPAREEWMAAVRDLAHGLIRYQDAYSGLWYQVVDKGDRPDNWLESSCTSLFVYTIVKAIGQGALGEEHLAAAVKGYEGLLRILRQDGQGLIVPDICVGTSAGDYTNYITRERSENDLHGVGAFVMACCAMETLMTSVIA